MEMIATDLAEISLDVTVPLKGGKVHGSLLVPVRSEARPPRLRPRTRKRRLGAQRGGSSTTGGSSTWWPPSDARRDPTQTRRSAAALCHRHLTLSSWYKCQYFVLKPDKIHPCFVVK